MHERRERESEFPHKSPGSARDLITQIRRRGCSRAHTAEKTQRSRRVLTPVKKKKKKQKTNMMEVVLTRLRDFSCKTSTFNDSERQAVPGACRDPGARTDHLRDGGEGNKLDIEGALAWLRRELVRLGREPSLTLSFLSNSAPFWGTCKSFFFFQIDLVFMLFCYITPFQR